MTGAEVNLKSFSFDFFSSTSNLAYEQIIAVWCKTLNDGSSI